MRVEVQTLEGGAVTPDHLQLILICVGLVLAIFIAAVDETIVATALGAITSEFKANSESAWVSGAYLLTVSASTPLYGKFSDIFGRKSLKVFAMAVFLGGSVMSGVARSMAVMVVGRAIAGWGAGGLIALSFIIISDIVPLKSRGLYMSLINGTFAIANVAGPLLGGLMVDRIGWRWVFYINIPVVVVSALVVIFGFQLPRPSGSVSAKLGRIDVVGTSLLLTCITLFVLAMNWGGHTYPWASVPVLLSLGLSAALLGMFIYVEGKVAVEPVLPVKSFNRNVLILSFISLTVGWVMFVLIYHWPLYFQIVSRATATQAGLELLPLMLGVCIFAAVSGFITSIGSYRLVMWVGMGVLVLGCCLMARLNLSMARAEQIIYPQIIGMGIGLNIQTVIIAAQASVGEKDSQAATTGFVTFCLNLGGILGLTVLGSILNNLVKANLTSKNFSITEIDAITQSLEFINQLPPHQYPRVISAYVISYRNTLLCLVPVAALGLIATLFLKNGSIDTDATQLPAH